LPVEAAKSGALAGFLAKDGERPWRRWPLRLFLAPLKYGSALYRWGGWHTKSTLWHRKTRHAGIPACSLLFPGRNRPDGRDWMPSPRAECPGEKTAPISVQDCRRRHLFSSLIEQSNRGPHRRAALSLGCLTVELADQMKERTALQEDRGRPRSWFRGPAEGLLREPPADPGQRARGQNRCTVCAVDHATK
jgi:hypothetical protein